MASCPIIHFDLRIFFEKVCICTHGNIQKKDHRKVEKKSLNLILKVVKLDVSPLTTFFVTYIERNIGSNRFTFYEYWVYRSLRTTL